MTDTPARRATAFRRIVRLRFAGLNVIESGSLQPPCGSERPFAADVLEPWCRDADDGEQPRDRLTAADDCSDLRQARPPNTVVEDHTVCRLAAIILGEGPPSTIRPPSSSKPARSY